MIAPLSVAAGAGSLLDTDPVAPDNDSFWGGHGFLGGPGLPGLIDIHTHFMPEKVMKKAWAYFVRAGPLVGRPWDIVYRDDETSRVQRLSDFGVRAFTSLIDPHKENMASWLNEWAADFCREDSGLSPLRDVLPRT